MGWPNPKCTSPPPSPPKKTNTTMKGSRASKESKVVANKNAHSRSRGHVR